MGHDIFDTVVPWPDIYGTWINKTRDLNITVSTYKTRSDRLWVEVEFRSLCTGQLLARGTRFVDERDSERDYLRLTVRNYTSGENPLIVTIREPKQPNKLSLEVKIHGQRGASIHLLDWFEVQRP
jgi:hypothetical protein